jgi:hypothetical protein
MHLKLSISEVGWFTPQRKPGFKLDNSKYANGKELAAYAILFG